MRAIPIDDFLEGVEHARSPDAHDWRRLVAEGRAARADADSGRWRIGRLSMLVEQRYRSGALKRFAQEIGESYGSVRRFRWVVSRYAPEARLRFAALSFSHFQAVAGVPERLAWLQRAERGRWSVERLVRESRGAPAGPPRGGPRALRRPIESITRSLARLAEEGDDRALLREGRAWLSRALAELAAEVERVRSRLRAGGNGHARPVAVRQYAPAGNGHRRTKVAARR